MSLDHEPAAAGSALFSLAQARQNSTQPWLVDLSLNPARIELSGRVLVNWWAKNAGLLDSLFALEPGDRVAIDAPPHWRVLPLALAAWGLGATLGDATLPDPQLLITTDPDSALAASAPEVLAVTTQALAVSFGGKLPGGVTDHAAEVRAQPDQLLASPAAAAQACWEHDGVAVPLARILAEASASGEGGASSAASWLPEDAGLAAALRALLACGQQGSLVLTPAGGAGQRILDQERVTRQA